MTEFQQKVFNLWEKVQKGDKVAKKEFKKLYLEKYPKNGYIVDGTTGNWAKEDLHCMYSHLFRLKKKWK